MDFRPEDFLDEEDFREEEDFLEDEDVREDDFRPEDFLAVDFREDDFRPEDFFAVDLRDEDFPPDLPEDDERLLGTLAPFSRASESPIAIACLRLLTLPPFPLFPRSSVPFFRRRIALSTLLLAPRPYLRPLDFFFVAMPSSSCRG